MRLTNETVMPTPTLLGLLDNYSQVVRIVRMQGILTSKYVEARLNL